MTWIDFVFLGAVGLSTFWSFRQGFIMEVFYTLSVLLGLFCAFLFYPYFTPLLTGLLGGDDLGTTVAFGTVFLFSAILLVLLGLLCHNFVHFVKLGFFDRIAGGLLGFFRAVVAVAVVIVIVVAVSGKNKPKYIENSYFCQPVVEATNWTMNRVPYLFDRFKKDYGQRTKKWLKRLREE